jgi:hypothetical protein
VVDALVGFLERLVLLLRHIPAVMLRSGVRDNDVRWPRDVVLRSGRRRQLVLERPRWRGWRPMAAASEAARRCLLVVLCLLQPRWHLHGTGSVEEIKVVLLHVVVSWPVQTSATSHHVWIAAIRVRGTRGTDGRLVRPHPDRCKPIPNFVRDELDEHADTVTSPR